MKRRHVLQERASRAIQRALRPIAVTSTSPADHLSALAIALGAALIFFWPALRAGSVGAGYVFTGDSYHFLLPATMAVVRFFSQGTFQGLDLSVAGGSTELFLRANFPVFDPVLLVSALALSFDTLDQTIRSTVLMEIGYAVIGCYATVRLCERFLDFDRYAAAFVAIGYVFSINMVRALGYSPYFAIACYMPAAMTLALGCCVRPNVLRLLAGAWAALGLLLAGYAPVGLACMVLAATMVAAWCLILRPDLGALQERLLFAARGFAPLLLGTLIALPYYVALLANFSDGRPANLATLAASAHDLSEQPQHVLRLLSESLAIPGRFAELSIHWGSIGLAIVILFVAAFSKARPLSPPQGRLLALAATIHVAIWLPVYGDSSVFSDMVFYFVPFIGTMHIYQRHLLAGQFFLLLSFAVMLRYALGRESLTGPKVALSGFSLLLFIVSCLTALGVQPLSPMILSERFVFELLLVTIFLFSFIALDRRITLVAATVFLAAPNFNTMYDFASAPHWSRDNQRQLNLPQNVAAMRAAGDFMLRNSDRAITKYVDATPGVHGYMPKNLPWFLGKAYWLSTYQGYDMHVATPVAYVWRMSYTGILGFAGYVLRPDWEWARQTGAQFVAFERGNPSNDPRLVDFADLSRPELIHALPDGKTIIAPLRFTPLEGEKIVFDNGILRVRAPAGSAANFRTDRSTRFSLTLDVPRGGTVEYLFWPDRNLKARVNGREAAFKSGPSGLAYVELPPGPSTLLIRYWNGALALFLAGYSLFGLALAAAILLAIGRLAARGLPRRHGWRIG